MVMVVEIKHGSNVKRCANIGEVGLIHALMIHLHANEQIG